MLRAIIFDCDGVIADTEPLHLAAFQRVLAEEGIALTEDEYYNLYLALDDRHCFQRVYHDRKGSLSEPELESLIGRKAALFEPVLDSHLRVFPGVREFIRSAGERLPLAVASGALRHEVEAILRVAGIQDCFRAIVCAEDTSIGKPDPEPFQKALARLISAVGERIAPRECLVVEDSIHGIEGALAAGMRCLGVTNSYSRKELTGADKVVESLSEVSLEELAALFE
jgi:HAD superfamily hydrolase (TIGR01509 family)